MADDERAQVDAARARTGYKGPIPGASEALRMAQRHGDFSGVRLRLQLGIPLSPDEQDALELLDRGAPAKRGPKDPSTAAAETVVCWRWLVERDGMSGPDARKLLAAIMGTTETTIKARLARADGLAGNIADRCFDVHAQRGVVPALLRDRDAKGHCLHCVDRIGRATHVECKCNPPSRPAFEETDEGAVVAVLLSFWQGRWAV
ncbi:hypothetical protein [Paracoccus yeei]|uniref:Uncharacterized protein n=1 Tax=Paracoccus yeei TaxID=147645 RepID=A0A5P2QTI3_9RHOB|nr:hypothetical protein [Paracoccus yeei]QEU07962.1 hypothetical protein FOB51_08055 [Paracoccus yeei]